LLLISLVPVLYEINAEGLSRLANV